MKHTIDVLDTPGDSLHPAVIPRVYDNDIIILSKEGMDVCTLLVYGISNCGKSNCPLKEHNRCICIFKVNSDKISILKMDGCTMRLRHMDSIMEGL